MGYSKTVASGTLRNAYFGEFENVYIGNGLQKEVLAKCASTGIVSSLLLFGLEQKLWDGALVVTPRKNEPFDPIIAIAKTADEILAAASSHYFPLPACLGLKEIFEQPGRFAFVGLPCHVAGLRKMQWIDPALREKIPLVIGLFCGFTPQPLGTKYLLELIQVPESEVDSIHYRERPWPGRFTVHLKNGKTVATPKDIGIGLLHFLFNHTRCALCPDESAELADISVGDAWNLDTDLKTIIVARNRNAVEMLAKAKESGYIDLATAEISDLMVTQRQMALFKKHGVAARMFLRKALFMDVPQFRCSLPKVQLKWVVIVSIIFLGNALMRFETVRRLLSTGIGIKILKASRFYIGRFMVYKQPVWKP
jgi:coenzyme F420 hydrogenase subunit beta